MAQDIARKASVPFFLYLTHTTSKPERHGKQPARLIYIVRFEYYLVQQRKVSLNLAGNMCSAVILGAIILEPVAHGCSVGSHDTEGASDYVAKGDRNQVFGKHLTNGDLGTAKHTERYDEHVGDRVIQAERNKSGDGEPNGSCRTKRRALDNRNKSTDDPLFRIKEFTHSFFQSWSSTPMPCRRPCKRASCRGYLCRRPRPREYCIWPWQY